MRQKYIKREFAKRGVYKTAVAAWKAANAENDRFQQLKREKAALKIVQGEERLQMKALYGQVHADSSYCSNESSAVAPQLPLSNPPPPRSCFAFATDLMSEASLSLARFSHPWQSRVAFPPGLGLTEYQQHMIDRDLYHKLFVQANLSLFQYQPVPYFHGTILNWRE